MYRHLTAHDIANTVRMNRSFHRGAFLVVEGETDIGVYKNFFDERECVLIPSNGKDNALRAIQILEGDKFGGVLGIVDADFWHLDGVRPESQNVFVTDTHDLETMMVQSEAFDAVFEEFGSSYRLGRWFDFAHHPEPVEGLRHSIRGMVFDAALPVGYLRWLSSSNQDLGLRFKGLLFKGFLNVKSFRMDVRKLVKSVVSHSHNRSIDKKALQSRVEDLIRQKKYNPLYVCSGHDVMKVLLIGFQKVFGNQKGRNLSEENLARHLGSAYTLSCFSGTRLYAALKEWEQGKSSRPILRKENSLRTALKTAKKM